MDIYQAKQRKRDLESNLRHYIKKSVDDFEKETGLTVTGLHFEMVDVTTFCDHGQRGIEQLACVHVDIDL